MTKDEVLALALEACELLVKLMRDEHLIMKIPIGLYPAERKSEEAITAIKQIVALDKMADNARDLGLDYEPCCKDQTCPKCKPAPVQPMAHIMGEIDHTGKVWKPVQPAPTVQEPVAWVFRKNLIQKFRWNRDKPTGEALLYWEPLYTNPPAAQPAPVQEPVAWRLNGIKRYEPEIFREDRIRMELDQSGEWVKYADVELLIATPPAAPLQPVDSEAKGAIMGAAYDFRDAHISGSMNLKRSAHAALENAVDAALNTPPAAQPAVPDAIHHTDLSEHPQYIEGWNDYRAAMMEMMK